MKCVVKNERIARGTCGTFAIARRVHVVTNLFREIPICMAASKRMQLIKAARRANRLLAKTFFALHKRSPSRAAFASNKIQFCRRISLKEIGMLPARRIVAYFVLIESSFVRKLWRWKIVEAEVLRRSAGWVHDSRRRRKAMAPTLAVPYQQDNV